MEVQKIDLPTWLQYSSDSSSDADFPDFDPFSTIYLEEDLWGFGLSWWEISRTFSNIDQLYDALLDCYEKIEKVKNELRELSKDYSDFQVIKNQFAGVSGSYFLIDEWGEKKYVVKPLDEEAGCIHSGWYPTLGDENPLRANLPLYHSCMREVLGYLVSELIGAHVVPKTEFGIIESDLFSHFSEHVTEEELERYFEKCPVIDKEKLCSIQVYLKNSRPLFEALHEFQMQNMSDEEIGKRICQQDFEDANIFVWVTSDTDAHMGNFLVYPKGYDEMGNEILGIKKIDNGLAFPDKNTGFANSLIYLPNAEEKLSDEGREKILNIDEKKLFEEFEKMGLGEEGKAALARIAHLKKLVEEPNLTIREIDDKMLEFCYTSGKMV